MLRNESTTYQGRYYQVANALMHPRSVQQPRPPLTIAAAGRTTLRIAAQYADAWNTYGGFDLSLQATLQMLRQHSELLDQYCGEIGRDPENIVRSFLVGLNEEKPFVSVNAFCDFVERYREIGISEFIFYYDRSDMSPDKHLNAAMLECIATKAIPELRSEEMG